MSPILPNSEHKITSKVKYVEVALFHLCIPIKPKTNMQQKIAAMRADASKLHLVQEKRVSHVRQSPTHFWQVLPSSDPSAGFLDIK